MDFPTVLYPRAVVFVAVIIDGKEYFTRLIPSQVTLHRRAHSKPSECQCSIDGSVYPFSPVNLDSATVAVYLGNADTVDGDIADDDDNLRFVGICVDWDRDPGESPKIELKCQDLSYSMRMEKPIPKEAIPRYSDTIRQAIQRVIDNSKLAKNRIVIRNTAALNDAVNTAMPYQLSKLVHKSRQNHPIPIHKHDASCWEVIEQICRMSSRVVTMEGYEIVVRFATEVYGEGGVGRGGPAAAFVFGPTPENVTAKLDSGDEVLLEPNSLKPKQKKQFVRHRRGIKVFATEIHTRQQISEEWPTDANLPTKHLSSAFQEVGIAKAARKSAAKAARAAAKGGSHSSSTSSTKKKAVPTGTVKVEKDRDIVNTNACMTRAELLQYAKFLWYARSVQEVEGSIETPLFIDPYLDLNNGDRVLVQINALLEQEIAGKSNNDAIAYLTDSLQMDRNAAAAFVAAARHRQYDIFYTKSVKISWSRDQRPSVAIEYMNLLVAPKLGSSDMRAFLRDFALTHGQAPPAGM